MHGSNNINVSAAQGDVTYQGDRRPGGLTSVPAPMTRLELAHASIESAVDSLRERIGILSSRMGSVMQPAYPTETAAGSTNSESRPSSPAVESAERLAMHVRGIEQTVIDLLERLEA